LSHECRRYIDVDAIWKEQAVPVAFTSALKVIIPGVRDVIVNPPSSQRNVTEWCKKDDCWSAVLERPIRVKVGPKPEEEADTFISPAATALSTEQQELIEAIRKVPAEVWFALSAWAKNTSSLQPWQRGLAYSLGRLLATAKEPSIKQAVQGRNLLLESVRLGFIDDALRDEQLEPLRMLQSVNAAT